MRIKPKSRTKVVKVDVRVVGDQADQRALVTRQRVERRLDGLAHHLQRERSTCSGLPCLSALLQVYVLSSSPSRVASVDLVVPHTACRRNSWFSSKVHG